MKKLHKTIFTTLALGMGLFLASCSTGNSSMETEKLQVVTTFYPMYDFTQQITQDSADVSLMVPSGTDTHSFEPSAKEVAQIQEADVFVYNSEEMETWVPSILESIDASDVVVINASEGIPLLETESEAAHADEEEEHGHEVVAAEEEHAHEVDPHIWLDPVLAQEEVANIKEGLIEADPENKADYTENAAAFQQELQQLHEDFAAAFEGAENRTFITQHAAFAYLAERYDLHQVAIAGLSTSQEPSPSELAEIAEFIEAQHPEYIYFGKTTSSNIAETLAYETGTQMAVLDPIEGITDEDQAAGIDYVQAMRNNLKSLQLSIQ